MLILTIINSTLNAHRTSKGGPLLTPYIISPEENTGHETPPNAVNLFQLDFVIYYINPLHDTQNGQIRKFHYNV